MRVGYSRRWAVGSGQYAVGSMQWAVCSGQYAVGSMQYAVGGRQWAVGGRQWAVGGRQWAVNDMAKNYRELIAWQKAMELVEMVYGVSKSFPQEEMYGLTSQIRRAAVSIPSNIAEGEGRDSEKEFVRFLFISHGSLREVETQLMIAERLHYITAAQLQPINEQCNEVGRIINGLIRHLKNK